MFAMQRFRAGGAPSAFGGSCRCLSFVMSVAGSSESTCQQRLSYMCSDAMCPKKAVRSVVATHVASSVSHMIYT